MPRSLAEIDALLAADKTLFGAPRWIERGPRATLTAAVVDVQHGVVGGLVLHLSALVRLPAPQRGTAVLVLDGAPLQRLSFRPDHPHINPARHPIPPDLRRTKLPADRTRIYLWRHDRTWPRADRLGVAASVDPEPATLSTAFALFLSDCAIEAQLPTAPHSPTLEF